MFEFDYFLIQKANYLSKQKEYLKSAKIYEKINSQKALLNAANNYYRAKKYKKALKLYLKINDKSLQFEKFYNLANTYVKLKEFKKAIFYYQKALAIKNDKDAQYNLHLILALLKKKQKKKTKKSKNTLKITQKKLQNFSSNKNYQKDLREYYYQKRLKELKFNTLLIPLKEEN